MDKIKLNELQKSLLDQIKERIEIYKQHMRDSNIDSAFAISSVLAPLSLNLHETLNVEPAFSDGVLSGAKEEGVKIPSIEFYAQIHAVEDLVNWIDRETSTTSN